MTRNCSICGAEAADETVSQCVPHLVRWYHYASKKLGELHRENDRLRYINAELAEALTRVSTALLSTNNGMPAYILRANDMNIVRIALARAKEMTP